MLKTFPEQHAVPVHGKMVRERGSPGQVPGNIGARSNHGNAGLFPEVLAEQVVGRTMGIGERRGALPVMQAVPQDITERSQNVVIPIEPEQEVSRIEEGTVPEMPGPVILGDPHLEHAAQAYNVLLLGISDTVEVGGHHGIHPKLHLAVERFERQNVGDLSDVFVVPEQDLPVACDTEMVQLFHCSSRSCLQDSESPSLSQPLRILF